MKSPANQKIIQIDITNACQHSCANCTRFCGHHKKPYFMEEMAFEQAVKSMNGYKGMVGVMGGEPTIHPKFEQLINIYQQHIPAVPLRGDVAEPIKDFCQHRNKNLNRVDTNRRGLWTSLGKRYAQHYELTQDVFAHQSINDHTNTGLHQALLITRKELGIPDEKWVKYRDECWIQNLWSSSITPKGAFFCEVAGALDMLFDGPGGWPIVEGWWRRKPEDFGDQLQWCELCSACLPVPRKQAHSSQDIISPALLEKLKEVGSPKVLRGTFQAFDPASYDEGEYQRNTKNYEWYLPDDGDNTTRVQCNTEASIYKKKVNAITVCVNYSDYLDITLARNVKEVDSFTVVTTSKDKATQEIARKHGAKVIISDRIHEGGAPFNKAKGMNDGLRTLPKNQWVLILDSDIILPDGFMESINGYVLNPGALYYTKRWGPLEENLTPFLDGLDAGMTWHDLYWKHANKTKARKTDRLGNDVEHFPYGYFQLWHPAAKSIGRLGERWYDEKYNTAEYADMVFGMKTWPAEKVKSLPVPEFDVIHLPHGAYKRNWKGRVSPKLGELSEVPQRPPEPQKSMAVGLVVAHVALPMKRLYEFMAWNVEQFEQHGVTVYLVSDIPKEIGPMVKQVVVGRQSIYSPSRMSNIGIRQAIKDKCEGVVKTDIDCLLTAGFWKKLPLVVRGQGQAPYYMLTSSPERLGPGKHPSRSVGTMALHRDDWDALRGYDERMYGYGREDGELFDRAKVVCEKVKRLPDLVYHIEHEDRKDDQWYPLRRQENIAIGTTKWHTIGESVRWGR